MAPIDPDVLRAVAYCRLGGPRPASDASFHEAKAIGLLDKTPCWGATERGVGALVAAGLMHGEPAPRYSDVVVLWAVSERYPHPQFVGAWHECQWEHLDHDEVEQEFRNYGAEQGWRFFSTHSQLPLPAVPPIEAAA